MKLCERLLGLQLAISPIPSLSRSPKRRERLHMTMASLPDLLTVHLRLQLLYGKLKWVETLKGTDHRRLQIRFGRAAPKSAQHLDLRVLTAYFRNRKTRDDNPCSLKAMLAIVMEVFGPLH
jgi:hypothetical protein